MPKIFYTMSVVGLVTAVLYFSFTFWQKVQAEEKLSLTLSSLTLQPAIVDLLPKMVKASEDLLQENHRLSSQIQALVSYEQEKTRLVKDLEAQINLLEKKITALQSQQYQTEKQVKNVVKSQAKIQKTAAAKGAGDLAPKSIIALPQAVAVSAADPVAASIAVESLHLNIFISEVQIAGVNDEKEEFVELYNPNDQDVDLTGWYLHKKTKTSQSESTFVSNTLLKDKNIQAKGYFLIAREGYFSNIADVLISNPLTQDNSLFLKNPDGQVVDTVGWGQAQDFEGSPAQNPADGQSIARLQEQDLGNNASDLAAGQPTPRMPNTSFVITVDQSLALLPDDLDNTQDNATPTNNSVLVVITEVQTEGQTTKDEFIELYNPGENDVDLTGFSLKKKTAVGTESNLVSASAFSGTILKHGFFLIVPPVNDDGTVNFTGQATPDLYYSGKSFSIAHHNTLLLYDKEGNLLDKVGFGDAQDFEGSPAQNPEPLTSIQRKDSGQETNDNGQDFIVASQSTPQGSHDL